MTLLDLYNSALALVPHDIRIASADEGGTEAQRCRENYDGARLAVLAAHPWGFLARESAPGGAAVSPYGVGYRYERPADALLAIGLFDPFGRRASAVRLGREWQSPAPDAVVRYTVDEPDPAAWPAPVAEAVRHELASRLAAVLSGNAQRVAELHARALELAEQAWELDQAETYGIGTPGTDGLAFVRARA